MANQDLYAKIDNALGFWMANTGKHPLQSLLHAANRRTFTSLSGDAPLSVYLNTMFCILGTILEQDKSLDYPPPPRSFAADPVSALALLGPNPTLFQILKTILPKLGYSGVADGDGCGCSLDDLAPCRSGCLHCRAGYLCPDPVADDDGCFTPKVFFNPDKGRR